MNKYKTLTLGILLTVGVCWASSIDYQDKRLETAQIVCASLDDFAATTQPVAYTQCMTNNMETNNDK